ncbi:hypothetical protein F0562_026703 [Nyssa sinensis]|uniref:Uncharacterized protein n=1 Tax=Nyssa sinensis TaxID=561372 RepID=A0A5J5BFS2_9ASTE|nr:hypothetical protein F0562_026703 [Nyssa sinensis]
MVRLGVRFDQIEMKKLIDQSKDKGGVFQPHLRKRAQARWKQLWPIEVQRKSPTCLGLLEIPRNCHRILERSTGKFTVYSATRIEFCVICRVPGPVWQEYSDS